MLRPFSINVRFARAGGTFIVMDSRHARVSRFSKPAPPARAKLLQWKTAFIEVRTGCYFRRNCYVLTWEITNFAGDSKYHVVSFIFTDFKVDLIQGVK